MRVCSLFSGIGGIDLGFIQAGFEIVWANEFDEDTARTYRYNFKDCNLVVKNIKKVNIDTIPDFDVLTAGFPCQPFSSAGMQKGFQDTRGTLFFEIVKVVERKRPKVIFLENVANLLGHDDGKTFLTIYNALVPFGYSFKYQVMDALDYKDRYAIMALVVREFEDDSTWDDTFADNYQSNLIKPRNDLAHNKLYYGSCQKKIHIAKQRQQFKCNEDCENCTSKYSIESCEELRKLMYYYHQLLNQINIKTDEILTSSI